MKKKRIKLIVGEWYNMNNTSNHAYFLLSKKYKRNGNTNYTFAFYRDLKYCGLVRHKEDSLNNISMLNRKSVVSLSPCTNEEYTEMNDTLKMINKR